MIDYEYTIIYFYQSHSNQSIILMNDANIKDNASNSQETNEQIDFCFLQIPDDLLSSILNFLTISDVISVGKTCQQLLKISKQSNSIYHLTFPGIVDFNHCSTEARFSNIRSLELNDKYPGAGWLDLNDFMNVCSMWKSVECLTISGIRMGYRMGMVSSTEL
eukprot:67142_1